MRDADVQADEGDSPVDHGASTSRRARLAEVFQALRRPKVAVMLALGFSSGLPFMLTGNTLGYWLRDEHTTLKAIGFIAWVQLAYSLKPLWAPLIDRLDAPLIGRRLGRRRGWMVVSQLVIGAGLIAMAATGPGGGLATLGAFALAVAFASATQDIVIDAWRIEAAEGSDELGLLSSAAQLGYRVSLIFADALILIAANHLGWPISYGLMAVLMGVGLVATLFTFEPARADEVLHQKAPLWSPLGFFDAVGGPFVAFFRTHGWLALLMLAMIGLYRLPEFTMGPMISPYYHDLGISKDVVGGIRFSVGLPSALVGAAAAGLSAMRFGFFRTLIAGSVFQTLSVACFAILAHTGRDPSAFAGVMAADSFGLSFAGVALVTYMSSLTSLGYTATQYAILTAAFALLGKVLKGFSGTVVEGLSHGRALMDAYAIFFLGAGAIGAPALVLCLLLAAIQGRRSKAAQASLPASARTS